MSTTPTPPPSNASGPLGLSKRALLVIAAAFGIGLLLFLFLWLGQRNDDEFFRAGSKPAGQTGQAFEPLPMPDAAGGDAAPGNETREPSGTASTEVPTSTGGVIEEPAPAPLPADPASESPFPSDPVASAGGSSSARPIESPPPDYPARAHRRGESGTVLLQVHVDENGRPRQVQVVQSSRSRDLDREAQRTVQRWRFAPATRGGQPVASKVLVPIEFNR